MKALTAAQKKKRLKELTEFRDKLLLEFREANEIRDAALAHYMAAHNKLSLAQNGKFD